MIFRYAAPADHSAGGFSFPLNRATVTSFRRTRKYNGRGRRWLSVATMRVDGKITAASQAALTTAINAMESNFTLDLTLGSVSGLYLDDGVTPTSHVLESLGTRSGVKVLDIQYGQKTGGAEYTNLRSFTIVLQAEYIQTGVGGDVMDYRETIRTVGNGGPDIRRVNTWGGLYKQEMFPSTPQHIYQSGYILQHSGYPGIVPTPIYPIDSVDQEETIENISPTNFPMGIFEFGVRWSYHMVLLSPVFPPVPGTA